MISTINVLFSLKIRSEFFLNCKVHWLIRGIKLLSTSLDLHCLGLRGLVRLGESQWEWSSVKYMIWGQETTVVWSLSALGFPAVTYQGCKHFVHRVKENFHVQMHLHCHSNLLWNRAISRSTHHLRAGWQTGRQSSTSLWSGSTYLCKSFLKDNHCHSST